MKRLLSVLTAPTKKEFRVLAGIQFVCIAVLWLISESRKDYFIAGFFSLLCLSSIFLQWQRVQKSP